MRARVLLGIVLSAATVTAAPAPILVSAAISLTDALTEVAGAYREATGQEVRFNFAGSNVLARQIVNGAPADLFISADQAQMDVVVARGAVLTPVPLLRNRLAIVTPSGNGAAVKDVNGLTGLRRIAVGDPAAVPAGVYAREYLQRTGLWPDVEARLLPFPNVRAALNAVAAGGADAGMVYESDAAASRSVDLALVIDGPHAPAIVYPAAVVAGSRNRDAALRFLEFLRSARAGGIFVRYKFTPVGEPKPSRPSGR